MEVLYVIIPLMVVAVLVAVTPVLLGSIRHDNAMNTGEIETGASAAREADFWHRMLGHRRRRSVATTPKMVSDAEVLRVSGTPQDRIETGGDSLGKAPASSRDPLDRTAEAPADENRLRGPQV